MSTEQTPRHLETEELERVALEEGSLPGPRRSHLDGCALCRRELASLRDLHETISGLPYHAPPPGFADAVMSRVRLSAPWYVRALAADWTPWAGLSAGALAAAAIAFWGWLLTRPAVALEPILSVLADWARTALWDLVVGAGRLLYDTGLVPAAAEAAGSLTPGAAAAIAGVLALLGALASVTVFKLMELPVPAAGSGRRR